MKTCLRINYNQIKEAMVLKFITNFAYNNKNK